MCGPMMLTLSVLLVSQPPGPVPAHRRVLVAERVGASWRYEFQGRRLDPDHLFAELGKLLPHQLEEDSELFVLLGPSIPVGEAFDLGSALSMEIGFKNIRYFSFSRDARRMQEVSLYWERYVFSVDGSLQKAEY